MEKIWHRECVTGRRFIIKIQPGQKITATLLAFAESKDIHFASMVSAVGSVRDVEFKDIQTGAHLPMTEPRIKTHRLEGPMELLGLEGNIALDADKRLGAQFHILASKASGEVVGGHLVDAEVFATCEIVLAEYLVEGIERYHSATTGVDTLYFEEQ
ncbi:MAG TPA: PPC domain-containing DNA-binding protein [Geothrix sp.]|jgi:predicted DNA-binding protein with PD1-like motif